MLTKVLFSPFLPLLFIVSQVLISGKEEPEIPLSPAMDAVIRVFKRVCGLSENEGDAKLSGAAGVAFCSIRFLVASTQAINLIGKQGSLIKSIQEGTGASVRVLPEGKLLWLCTPLNLDGATLVTTHIDKWKSAKEKKQTNKHTHPMIITACFIWHLNIRSTYS